MDSPTPGNGSTNVTERQLTVGLWYLTHKEQLRTACIGVLIGVNVLLWGTAIFGFIRFVVIDGARLDRSLEELVSSGHERAAIIRQQRAKPIIIAEVHLVPAGAGRYDAAARVTNPNPAFLARLTYTFAVAGAAEERAETVVLPGTERWLTQLNVESNAQPRQAALTITTVAWERLGHRTLAQPVRAYIAERSNVTVSATQLISPRELATNVSRAAFTLTNNSAYGLRDLEVTVLLRGGTALVGVNRMTIPILRAGETRTDAATWFHALGSAVAIDVVPYVNVFDPDAFLQI